MVTDGTRTDLVQFTLQRLHTRRWALEIVWKQEPEVDAGTTLQHGTWWTTSKVPNGCNWIFPLRHHKSQKDSISKKPRKIAWWTRKANGTLHRCHSALWKDWVRDRRWANGQKKGTIHAKRQNAHVSQSGLAFFLHQFMSKKYGYK